MTFEPSPFRLRAIASTRCSAILLVVATIAATLATRLDPAAAASPKSEKALPPGAFQVEFENLEGLILIEAGLHGEPGRDTSGLLVLDTGAGFLGLDSPLAEWLGVSDPGGTKGIALAMRALRRLEIGGSQMDQLSPVLLMDADVIRRVTGRAVLGLAGQGVFHGRALWIDYDAERVVVVPSPPAFGAPGRGDPWRSGRTIADTSQAAIERSRRLLAALLTSRARPVRFALAGDRKMLVRARIGDGHDRSPRRQLTLVLDTGATKNVLFEPALSESLPSSRRWRSVRGLVAPTLIGNSDARLTLAPVFELEAADGGAPIRRHDVDCAVVETELAAEMTEGMGQPVHGLLGYSFLGGYRVAIDPTNLVLWLDPLPHDAGARRYEHTHVGLQIERDDDLARVLGVAEGSPAEEAGIEAGDVLVSVDDVRALGQDVLDLTHRLEGPEGSRVKLVVRRGGVERVLVLSRRRLL